MVIMVMNIHVISKESPLSMFMVMQFHRQACVSFLKFLLPLNITSEVVVDANEKL